MYYIFVVLRYIHVNKKFRWSGVSVSCQWKEHSSSSIGGTWLEVVPVTKYLKRPISDWNQKIPSSGTAISARGLLANLFAMCFSSSTSLLVNQFNILRDFPTVEAIHFNRPHSGVPEQTYLINYAPLP